MRLHKTTLGTPGSRALRAFLEEIYSVPEPMNAYEDWERSNHWDLVALTEAELHRERDRLEIRLKLDRAPHHWLLERFDALGRALADAR
jgi:hypothetical protein